MKTAVSLFAAGVLACGGAILASGGAARAAAPNFLDRLCATDAKAGDRDAKAAAHLEKHLQLSAAQKSAFEDFQATRRKAEEEMKTKVCAQKPDVADFKARLELHRKYLEDRLAVLAAENPKLIAFYESLDDKQRALFNELREHMRGR